MAGGRNRRQRADISGKAFPRQTVARQCELPKWWLLEGTKSGSVDRELPEAEQAITSAALPPAACENFPENEGCRSCPARCVKD